MKMLLTFKNFLLIAAIVSTSVVNAQLVTVNNIHFHVNVDAVVQINGDVHTIDSCFYNLGNVHIEGSYINDGITYGGDYAGNGFFEVFNDWENNQEFNSGLGLVSLNGYNQWIKGTEVTSFNDLLLTGTGVKFQEVDAIVTNNLDLTDRELATETSIMTVTNVDVDAIDRTTGFVSSLLNGSLNRHMLLPQPYLFPVGSSVGIQRYRPVTLKMNNPTDTNIFAIRMVNNLATDDGYDIWLRDDTICFSNMEYYHLINQAQGVAPTDVTVEYDMIQDPYDWNKLSHWDTVGVDMWHNTGNNYSYLNQPTLTTAIVKIPNGWTDFSPYPFILSYEKPTITDLLCNSELCFGNQSNYTLNGGAHPGDYEWTVSGGTIVSDPTDSTIVVDWTNPGNGTVTVSQNIFGFCNTNELSCNVIIHPKPDAVVVSDTNYIFEHDLIHLMDTVNTNMDYSWDFGDGYSNNLQNPYHTYEEPGDYTVTYIVESPFGCKDTATYVVHVVNGAVIPNVFTPNGDGFNDNFYIKNSGSKSFALQIFNRWGNLIFETNNPHVGWDGKTKAGIDAPSGTYYFIFKGNIADKAYNETGSVTLVRE